MTYNNVTSRHRRQGPKVGFRAVAAALLLTGSMALGGCALLDSGNQTGTPVPPPTSSTLAADAAEPTPAPPKSPAQEFSVKLRDTLGTLAGTTKAPNREQMSAAMVTAGADPAAVEVSIDITPTGLAVDAIEAATRVDAECVVGQVRDGDVAVTILPALESGRCFVGDVH